MKTSISAKIVALGVIAALAIPLSASARHAQAGDVFAGVVIGCVAGTVLDSAANSSYVYVAPPPPPPPPPPQYYYAPPPQYYYAPPPPQYHLYPQPQSQFYGGRPHRGPRW